MPNLPEDCSELEADLRALRPRAARPDFAADVALESRLQAMHPRAPSAGFADRVAAACGPRIVTFPQRWRFPALAATGAAACLAFLVSARSPAPPSVTVNLARAPASPAEVAGYAGYARADDGMVLPVISLSDGRAYRARMVARPRAPDTFRAMPGGVMPVSYAPPASVVEYSQVQYE